MKDVIDPVERTAADFSREFAGYMATAADAYCKAVNVYHRQIIDAGGDLPPSDALTDAYTSVFSAIYEWRKREDRATAASEASGKEAARSIDADEEKN